MASLVAKAVFMLNPFVVGRCVPWRSPKQASVFSRSDVVRTGCSRDPPNGGMHRVEQGDAENAVTKEEGAMHDDRRLHD
jgi:hypothetical protein